MKYPVTVQNTTLGEGIPKICVPITGTTAEEIAAQAKAIAEKAPDLVEWRFDFFGIEFTKEAEEILDSICEIFSHIPMLFTFRTLEEGGNRALFQEGYEKLLLQAANCEKISLIDVELERTDEKLIKNLQNLGKKVLVSRHYFSNTPDNWEMEDIFCRMEALGADLLKLAVMPQQLSDVVRLMETTKKMSKACTRPLISMSMGALGAMSRICGEKTGSVLTFGAVGATSAPGQIEIEELRRLLKLLH